MPTRRRFLALAPAVLFAEPLLAETKPTRRPRAPQSKALEVAPAEDLMREHGVLRRILLIYEHYAGALTGSQALEAAPLVTAAQLIRRFVEDYHEKLEESYVFPRFQKAGQMWDLVQTLQEQHFHGRNLTTRILETATPTALARQKERIELARLLRLFIRMYRPHAAREDTVLFPAFKQLVTPDEYDKLGDQFEATEDRLFGKDGFQHIVRQVGELEQSLGIYDLKQLTPAI